VRVYCAARPESLSIILVNFLLSQLEPVMPTTSLNAAFSFICSYYLRKNKTFFFGISVSQNVERILLGDILMFEE